MSQLYEWIRELRHMEPEQLQHTLESYAAWGPLPGIAAPIVEAMLPFLPLLLIVAANANIYGLGLGILYSWIGVSVGCLLVFWVARTLGGRFGSWLRRRFPGSDRFFRWIEEKGFTPIFLLACFPFTPSSLINLAAGLSGVPPRTFTIAILLGKAVMITSISLISFDITDIVTEPWRLLVAAAVLLGMWFFGKKLELRFQT
ncbi:TVP38/TMEM64 family protein [Paenibacillus sp. IB182496]|uniref:TVP38/TMEM64 family membrane protein n=1 Tax=Paenibacillus sabuli TaxID=2772509 RepID=A0A927GUZ1_9BACL|nr:TVP38/TMEM64 family protein [Paenibacillus sabuli]MBD2848207.1 TVP38/TMEM64 family protein [Paenibacillus sabuli]